jgi:hypothetical protein
MPKISRRSPLRRGAEASDSGLRGAGEAMELEKQKEGGAYRRRGGRTAVGVDAVVGVAGGGEARRRVSSGQGDTSEASIF